MTIYWIVNWNMGKNKSDCTNYLKCLRMCDMFIVFFLNLTSLLLLFFHIQDTSAENFSKKSIKLTESLSSMAAQAAADREMGVLNMVSCTTRWDTDYILRITGALLPRLITPENARDIDKVFSFLSSKPKNKFKRELSKLALLSSFTIWHARHEPAWGSGEQPLIKI